MKKTPLTYACELHAALVSVDEAHRAIVVRGFLEGLARSRKTNLRPRIVTAFNDLALAIEGYRAGTFTTAAEPDAATRAKLKAAFKNVIFEERTDPSLLGGAIVEVEDTRIDGSVRAKLNALKHAITNANN
jgi:F-type H+-transporting ATPase subunit delta